MNWEPVGAAAETVGALRGIGSPDEIDDVERDRVGRLLAALYIRLFDAHRHGDLEPGIAQRRDPLARYSVQVPSGQGWWSRQRENLRRFNPEVAAYIDDRLEETRDTG